MKSMQARFAPTLGRRAVLGVTLGLGLAGLTVDAHANHPVMVEGNCNVPPAGSSPTIAEGTCGDYDGDGLIGAAEDADGDRVFGTVNGALGAGGGTGANQNGRVLIVTSGTFAEVVAITAANGNVTVEAAPGVEANIDAVLQGDPGSGARQGAPGIVVDAPANRRVVLRNLVSRNWTEGIRVQGGSHVTIDGCRIENNVNYGIRVLGGASAVVNDSRVDATGYRVGGGMSFPDVNTPSPGIGIEYEPGANGVVANSIVTGSFAREIRGVRRNGVIQFD